MPLEIAINRLAEALETFNARAAAEQSIFKSFCSPAHQGDAAAEPAPETLFDRILREDAERLAKLEAEPITPLPVPSPPAAAPQDSSFESLRPRLMALKNAGHPVFSDNTARKKWMKEHVGAPDLTACTPDQRAKLLPLIDQMEKEFNPS